MRMLRRDLNDRMVSQTSEMLENGSHVEGAVALLRVTQLAASNFFLGSFSFFFSIWDWEPAAGRKRSRCNSWAHPSEDFSFFTWWNSVNRWKEKNRKATEAPPLASSGHSQVVGWETTRPESMRPVCLPAFWSTSLPDRPHVVKCKEMKADRNSRIRQAELANDARQVFPFSSPFSSAATFQFPHFSVRAAAPL